jgi:hypothetical protein
MDISYTSTSRFVYFLYIVLKKNLIIMFTRDFKASTKAKKSTITLKLSNMIRIGHQGIKSIQTLMKKLKWLKLYIHSLGDLHKKWSIDIMRPRHMHSKAHSNHMKHKKNSTLLFSRYSMLEHAYLEEQPLFSFSKESLLNTNLSSSSNLQLNNYYLI